MKKFLEISQAGLILLGLMMCGLFLTSSLTYLPVGGDSRQWLVFSAQNILAFILPSVLAWRICFRKPALNAVGADTRPSAFMISVALLIYVLGVPALNQIIDWNQNIHLPAAFSSFEEWCREMERLAASQTESLLGNTSITNLIVNILVIGVLTGIGEEFFFRGAMQRMLLHCKVNHHAAIWSSAFVFSLLHFQFFGFVPRVLLGAWFGYLYWWSGSIWVNSFAHALNNSLVIISTWLISKGYLSGQFDTVGVADGGFPVWALLSASAVALSLYLLRFRLNGRHGSDNINQNSIDSLH